MGPLLRAWKPKWPGRPEMSDNAPNSAVVHQAFQGFPRIDSPLVDTATGYITQPWQRLLIRLWQMAGGSFSTIQGSSFTRISPDASSATLVDVATGKDISTIELPVSNASGSALVGLQLEPPADPQRDFSYLSIIAPPAAPAPDPLLALALNPLAGLSP